jgi:hypothetical protein
VTECKILVNNKEAKRFVDVAPPWGEPRISSVSSFALCCVIFVMHFMCNEYICCSLNNLLMFKSKWMLYLTYNAKS